MKARLTLIGTVTVFVSSVTLASAVAPSMEPNNGFVHGGNPEWSAPHMEFHGSEEDHRAYHSAREKAYRVWLELWAAMKGTEGYEAAHRDYRAEMNAAHRAWHDNHSNIPMEDEDMGILLPPAGHGGISTLQRDKKSRRIIEGEQHEQWLMDSAGF